MFCVFTSAYAPADAALRVDAPQFASARYGQRHGAPEKRRVRAARRHAVCAGATVLERQYERQYY